MRLTRHAVHAALLAVALPAQDRQPEHLLRLSFANGQQTRWRVTNEMTVKTTIGGRPEKVTLSVTLTTTVGDVTDKGVKVFYRIDRVAGDYDNNNQLDFDTDEDGEGSGPVTASFRALVGKSFVVEVDERGRRRKLEVPETVRDMDRQMDTDFLTQTGLLLIVPPEFPETPVAVGTKWKGVTRPEADGDEPESAYTSDYELLSVENGLARIRHATSMTYADPQDAAQKELGRRATRVLTFHLARGTVLAEEVVRVSGEDGPPGGFTVDIARTVEELPAEEKK